MYIGALARCDKHVEIPIPRRIKQNESRRQVKVTPICKRPTQIRQLKNIYFHKIKIFI